MSPNDYDFPVPDDPPVWAVVIALVAIIGVCGALTLGLLYVLGV